jgi:hypothetical protein
MGHAVNDAAAVAPRSDSTVRPWLITVVLAAAIFLALRHVGHSPARFVFPVSNEKPVHWFLVLRMPPITAQHESGIETMKTRYGQWLDTLTRAGYRPLLLSDVSEMIRTGIGVPPKSLMIVFDPGLRRTYQTVGPILKQHRWGAVWLSDEHAMQARHREYVTYHTARKMVASGLWDVGLRHTDGTYDFSIGQTRPFTLGRKDKRAWSLTNGSDALNRGNDLINLNRLNVVGDWMPSDLLNRVNAEVPVEAPSYLTIGNVQNVPWGTSQTQKPDAPPARFDLGVGKNRKSIVVSWLGTEGVDNFKATLDAASLTGTLAFRFRWDDLTGDGVQVSISNTGVTIDERSDFVGRTVARAHRDGRKNFNVRLLAVGDRMAMIVDDQAVAEIPPLATAAHGQGMSAIYLSDRISEVAHVDGLSISFTPLPAGSVAWPPTL